MRTWSKLLLGAMVLAITTPGLHAEQKLDRADFKLSVPDAWVEAPDVAEAALKATKGDSDQLEAYTVSYRAAANVPLMLGVFVRSAEPMGDNIRKEVSDFHTGMKRTIEKGGATFSRFDYTETATCLTSTFEAQQGPVRMMGVAVAAVRADGKLLGWSVECIYTGDLAADVQTCARVLASFKVVHPEKDLRPLNK